MCSSLVPVWVSSGPCAARLRKVKGAERLQHPSGPRRFPAHEGSHPRSDSAPSPHCAVLRLRPVFSRAPPRATANRGGAGPWPWDEGRR